MSPTRVLGLLNQWTKRPRVKFRQGFLGAPLQHRVGWGTASLQGVTVGVCPGRGLEGRPGCPLGAVCRASGYPVPLQALQK